MPFRNWTERPGERRCINCDQRLITVSERPAPTPELRQEPTVSYVCPDGHERWAYNAQSQEWRQMY